MHQYDIVLDVTVMNRTGDWVLLSIGSLLSARLCCHAWVSTLTLHGWALWSLPSAVL